MIESLIDALIAKGWTLLETEGFVPELSKGKITAGIGRIVITYITEGKPDEFNAWPMSKIKTGVFIIPADSSDEHLLPELKEMRDVVLTIMCNK